jgi:hypothetical protein
MSLIQGDDVVQNLSPATSDPSLRKAILPGCAWPKLDPDTSVVTLRLTSACWLGGLPGLKLCRTTSATLERSRRIANLAGGNLLDRIYGAVCVIVNVAVTAPRVRVNLPRVFLRRYAPRIAMVQTPETGHSDHGGTCRWPVLSGPRVRGVFGRRVGTRS